MCPLSTQVSWKRIGSLRALLARLRPGQPGSQVPAGKPWFRPGVEQFEDRFLPAVSLVQNFANINSNQTAVGTPPDTTMAVGLITVIGAVDTAITLTDKTGNGRVGPTDFSSFFAPVYTAGDTFREPSIVYDDQANRFYVAIVEVTPGVTTSQIDFAVSKGTAPATLGSGDWSVYAITEVNEGGTAFPDFPQMGWNNDAVFISTNQTNTASPHDHILAITKASLFTGGSLTLNSSNVPISSARNILIPARMHNEVTGDFEYFVQSQGAVTSTTVNVVQESGYLSGPGSFTSTPLTVNSYNNSPGVAGLTGQIDDRILSADWVDNGTTQHLVAAGNVGENGINLARWYEFNAPTSGAPTLLQQGDINLGPTIATSYPSIALNSSDSIAMTFLENGNGQATSMYVTGRQATDPMGALETPILVKAGMLPATAMNRGGDYSATEYDPATPGNFWSANQFQLAASASNLDWGTQIAAYTLVPGPVLTPAASQSASEGSARSFSLGSFSDPGSGPWSVTVNWGDGSMNTTFSAMSAGSLGSQSHTYAEEGSFTVSVIVTNTSTMQTGSGTFQVAVSMVGSSSITLLQNFTDINTWPPDTMMAVGPNTVVGAADFSLTLTNKTGGNRVGPIDYFTFFSSIFIPGDVGVGGAQIVYDDQAGRFYISILEIAGNLSTVAVDFAISKSNSPATLGSADWNFFQITAANEGSNFLATFPTMGWNNDAVFVSANVSNLTTGKFDHNLVLAIAKTSLLAGGPLSTQATDVNTGSERHILIPARMHHETAGNLEYFVQSEGGVTSTTVNVVQETGYLSGPGTFVTTSLTVNTYNNSPGVAGLTGVIDDRILSADWVDNGTTQHLVASGNVGVAALNLARWYEFKAPITGTPALLQQGDINLGAGIATSYPSIAINPADSIAMTFLENGNGQATSMYVTGRLATDPLNTMQDALLVQAGLLPATDANLGGQTSATEYDPANPANFWSANEFQAAASGSNFDSGTQIAEYTIMGPAGTPPVVTPPANQSSGEGSSATIPLGSFSDPDGGPWNVDINWGDGTTHTMFMMTAPGTIPGQMHTYGEEGNFTVTITVTDSLDNQFGTGMFPVSVSDPNVIAMAGSVSTTAGTPFSGAVATFTDPGGAEANDGTHYSASINWGDNTAASAGTITFSNGVFTVSGSHTYAAAGSYSITVTLHHEGDAAPVSAMGMVASLGQFVAAGLVKPISFWAGLQGQELLHRFGLTASGQSLGQWLATAFPNLYGGQNGAPNLSPFSNAQISSYYQSLFLVSKGVGLDAEVLATALEVFTTTLSLGGTTGQANGFTVNSNGLGAYSWNIGASGQAFGVTNNTVLDVYQILLAANNTAVGGEPWDSNTFLRNQAFTVFHALNGG